MTFEQLKDLTCKHFKVSKEGIEGKERKVEIIYAKMALTQMLFCNGYRVCEIATLLDVTHSTILHYLKTFETRMKYDVLFANTYNDFKKECN